MKKLFLTISLLFFISLSKAQTPGAHQTYVYDDFASTTSYDGAFWWVNESGTYSISRLGNNKLHVTANGADPSYSSFGLHFSNGLDLRTGAFVSFNVENLTSTKLVINLSLIDIDNNNLSIQKDTGDGSFGSKKGIADTIYPGQSKNVMLELSGSYVASSWLCNSPATCPKLEKNFRWDKVMGINFQFNGGAGALNDLPLFTGQVNFSSFQLGSEPCLNFTEAMEGISSICTNATGITFSVPVVDGATNYLWTVPDEAEIITGQGSHVITVNFGTKGGLVTVLPSKTGCNGSVSEMNVTLFSPINSLAVSGVVEVCERSENFYSVAQTSNISSYTWHLPAGSEVIEEEKHIIKVKAGSVSGELYCEMNNVCGTVESEKLNINVTTVGAQPVISKEGYVLTASDATYYQWYRFDSPISGQNGKTLSIENSGEYRVNISQDECPNFSNPVFVAISMLNGVNKTFVKDDFATKEPYTNIASGYPMIWWASSVYDLSRIGDGKLKIEVNGGDPHWNSFGVFWAFENADSTLDLSGNANVHMVIQNPTNSDADVWIQLVDINGKSVNILADIGDGTWGPEGYKTANVIIPANAEKEVNIDLTNGHYFDWNCFCPGEFDWTKIAGVIFQVNPGSDGAIWSTPKFYGTLFLKDFMVGTYISQDGNTLVASNARSYRWRRNGSFIESANQKEYTPVQSGDYSVELEDLDGKKYESSIIPVVITGTKAVEKNYKVFPNPSEGLYFFTSDAHSQILITDNFGRPVYQGEGSLVKLDLSFLPEGVYFMRISNNGLQFVEKLIKN
ncbi:MAG: T9SS type A sorting domain-containing protein [Cytophagaceae bacterium]